MSIKAATPEGFTQRTGAIGEYYDLPFHALTSLLEEGIYVRAAAMTDPQVMPEAERELLLQKLAMIDPLANYPETLEEEQIDTYDTTLKRLQALTDEAFARELERRFR